MTSWSGFALARGRASLGLLVTLLALVAVTTAIIAGTTGYSRAAATTAARGALTQGEPTQSGVQVQTRLADDPAAQEAAARTAIADAFAPAPVDIGRLVVTDPLAVQHEGTRLEGRLVVAGGPDLTADAVGLADLVTVVEGSWPAGEDGADAGTPDRPATGALHVGAAQDWGLAVGDVLVVNDRAIEVAATWQPVDPQEAYWFGDEMARTGVVDGDHGLLVVDEGLAAQLGAPFVRWTVRPDPTHVSPDDLSVLATGAETLRTTLREAGGITVRGITVEGDLAPTAATAATNLATARALGVVPLAVLLLVTGLAVVQLARLLAATREPQAQLLVARGASRGQVLATGLAESAAVAVVGAALGAALAWGVVQLVPGGELVTRTVLTVAGLTLLGVLVVLAAVTALQARRISGGQAVADRSGRARAATAVTSLALVLAAAGLTWWQLRRAGSPLVMRADGTLGTDLVAGAAPALLLAAAAVLAAALLGPLSRLAELVTRPTRSATGHLASAQVSRRLSVYAVPVVLTVLAVGATTLAALYSGTSAQLRDDLAHVAEGAPLRADLVRPPAETREGVLQAPPPDLAELPEVEEAVLVWHQPDARIGDRTVPLTLADTEALAAVVHRPAGQPGGLVPAGLSTLVDPGGQEAGTGVVPVPAGVEEITAELTVVRGPGKWEIARLDGTRQYVQAHRDMVAESQEELTEEERESLPEEISVDEEVAQALEMEISEARTPYPMTVRLLLRDVRTGMAQTVTSAPVEVPGAELSYDPQTLGDVTAEPSTTTATLAFALPPGREHTVEAVVVDLPEPGMDQPLFTFRTDAVQVDLALRAGGQDLLAGTGDWGSAQAMSAEQAAPAVAEAAAVEDPYVETHIDGSASGWSTSWSSNEVYVPTWVDTSGPTWHLESTWRTGEPQVVIAPGAVYHGPELIRPGERPGDAAAPDEQQPLVPVALTPTAAREATLAVGDEFTLTFPGGVVQARLQTLVDAVPGQRGTSAALADSLAVSSALARSQDSLTWPTQVWATPAGDAAAAVSALASRDDLRAVTGPGSLAVTDATSAARLVFWVAAAGSVLLAVTGIAAVAATLLGSRRAEVAVLRALGMPPAAQARSRALELVGVVLAAVAFGLLAGWLVGRGVVPELATSTTQPGSLQLPAALRLEALPWVVLLAAGAVAVLALAGGLAGRVRGQALDRDYREEIR